MHTFKVGLVGLGNVGRNVLQLLQQQQQQPPGERRGQELRWVADSRFVVSKERGEPFTPREIRAILEAKRRDGRGAGRGGGGGGDLSSCVKSIPNAVCEGFRSPSQEARILSSMVGAGSEWIVLDTASVPAEADYEVARAVMGSAGFCTASKTPWADFRLCASLYREAEERRTLLGLNCTTGVWVDQMESLPLVMDQLIKGRVTVTKRDNSSFNLFFSKLAASQPEEALEELERSGHLEPGAAGLTAEVRDQATKAKISANVCAILGSTKPSFVDETAGADGSGPASLSPMDIARWHLEGRRRRRGGERVFRALVTTMTLGRHVARVEDGDERGEDDGGELECKVAFAELPQGSPLARNFPGKSAILIEATDASFRWGERAQIARHGPGFVHSGYGGATRTAAKLMWEMRRISRLASGGRSNDSQFCPLPIIYADRLGMRAARSLKERIASSL